MKSIVHSLEPNAMHFLLLFLMRLHPYTLGASTQRWQLPNVIGDLDENRVVLEQRGSGRVSHFLLVLWPRMLTYPAHLVSQHSKCSADIVVKYFADDPLSGEEQN